MASARWFVGVDWGSEAHQVCILDPSGKELVNRSYASSTQGLEALVQQLLKASQGDPSSVSVAIERPHGAVVELLIQHDFAVYSINPKQLDRFRDRHTVAGAKDDRRDALVLAHSLMTDLAAFNRVQLSEASLVELRELLRIDEDLRVDENALQNRLREQLLRYFPSAVELMADRADPFLWELLKKASTPEKAKRLKIMNLESLLKKFRVRRITAEKLWEVLQEPQWKVSQGTIDAASGHVQLLIPRLKLVHQQRQEVAQQIEELLDQFMTQTESAEGPEEKGQHHDAVLLRSLPGVGRIVLATMLAEASAPIARRDVQALRCLGGIAPVTRRSGKQIQRLMRYACNARLRYAFYHWGRIAIKHDERAKAHYHALRARGHSHGRALRGVIDRLLSVAIAMLKSNTLYTAKKRRQQHVPAATPAA